MQENFFIIPPKDLSEEAIQGIIKNHLFKTLDLSEKTSLENHISRVRSAVTTGKLLLIFDKTNEDVIIASHHDYSEFRKKQKLITPVWHGARSPEAREQP